MPNQGPGIGCECGGACRCGCYGGCVCKKDCSCGCNCGSRPRQEDPDKRSDLQ